MEGLRIALVAVALALYGTLTAVALAILAARVVAGAIHAIAAITAFRRSQGRPLLSPALSTGARSGAGWSR